MDNSCLALGKSKITRPEDCGVTTDISSSGSSNKEIGSNLSSIFLSIASLDSNYFV